MQHRDSYKRDRQTQSGKCTLRLVFGSSTAMPQLRRASHGDVPGMCLADSVVAYDHDTSERRREIIAAVEAGAAFVATEGAEILGYAVLNYSFFGYPFLSLLMVAEAHRRSGVASKLVQHVEHVHLESDRNAERPRLFTSTNQSNTPMRALLKKLGFSFSGMVDHLDPGDPELFFSRALPGHEAQQRAAHSDTAIESMEPSAAGERRPSGGRLFPCCHNVIGWPAAASAMGVVVLAAALIRKATRPSL